MVDCEAIGAESVVNTQLPLKVFDSFIGLLEALEKASVRRILLLDGRVKFLL
jgi:hypothetical protein